MQCKKCDTDIAQLNVGSLKISYCPKCRAVWLKYSELDKLAENLGIKTPILNPAEMQVIKVKEGTRKCPACSQDMDKVYFNGIVLDKCTPCDSVLFDNGELSKFFRIYMKEDPGIIDNLVFLEKYCSKEAKKMNTTSEIEIQSKETERRVVATNGFAMLFIIIMLFLLAILLFFTGILVPGLTFFAIILGAVAAFLCAGFKMLKPQEAMALTLFGKYIGTLKGEGFHWVNPFARSVTMFAPISLKARTLENGRQKINDELGNPIEVGIIVIWEVQDTAKAVFNVDDYTNFLSSQSDSALRNIVRMYPYDAPEDSDKTSLRGDSQEISAKLKEEIQRNVKVAGLNIIDAKITHLAYAPEIAVAMLQRQQASAIIDAKKAIVEGAVGMVEMALNRLETNGTVALDNADKAKMVNNLLVTLCSNKEATPVVNNGN